MKDELLKKLKSLKSIEPDRDWSRASLMAILREKPVALETRWNSLVFRFSMVTALFVLIIMSAQKSSIPLKIAGLDAGQLKAEAEEMEIKLELAQIASSSSEEKSINTALSETAESQPGHLNTLVLEREAGEIEFANYENDEINNALEQIAD